MTKLGAIEFNDRILDALRDDKLLVFAGAGVSMGPPSNLAIFCNLTRDIAQGTGLESTEPLDRSLGQLHHYKVSVHERVVANKNRAQVMSLMVLANLYLLRGRPAA